jgi:hypothetical protein
MVNAGGVFVASAGLSLFGKLKGKGGAHFVCVGSGAAGATGV